MIAEIVEAYNNFVNYLPGGFKLLPPALILAVIIATYSLFIWFFYRFLAKRDIITLDLSKYNNSRFSGLLKFFASIWYLIEYVILAPIATLIWFSVFSILLIVLAKEINVETIVLISVGFIAAIRITAYMNEDLSKDLAKMFPFTLLGIAILTPGFFNVQTTLARLLEIPLFLTNLFYYFLFLIGLELILRLIYLPAAFFGKENPEQSEVKAA